MDLWDRIRAEISRANTKQEAVADHLGVHPVTFRKWMSQKIVMDANQIVSMAILFNTTVEALILGEDGKKYILEWAGQHGAKWSPPSRIADLVKVLCDLSDEKLEIIRPMILAAAGNKLLPQKAVKKREPQIGDVEALPPLIVPKRKKRKIS